MEKIKFGCTNLMVSKSGFGAIPIQRISFDESKKLLLKAFDNGINFYDTARMYTDSEEKIGYAMSKLRKDIVIATKSLGEDKKSVMNDLDTSLKNLKTDYIDIYQLHNPKNLPDPSDKESSYSALLKAKQMGKIRFIGITNHRLDVAVKAVESGLYDTVQYPINYLSTNEELNLIDLCKSKNIGLIAMKALSGGLIDNAKTAFAFLRQFDNIVPIWGIQREKELDEIISYEINQPLLDDDCKKIIKKDKDELSGIFCRACGYCLPCPANIPIPMAARMSLLLRRMPYQQFLKDEWKKQMQLINKCTNCNHCKDNCPYNLDTPNLLKYMLKDYEDFYESHSLKK